MFIYMVNSDCYSIGKPTYIGLYECFYFGRYPLSNATACPAFDVDVAASGQWVSSCFRTRKCVRVCVRARGSAFTQKMLVCEAHCA